MLLGIKLRTVKALTRYENFTDRFVMLHLWVSVSMWGNIDFKLSFCERDFFWSCIHFVQINIPFVTFNESDPCLWNLDVGPWPWSLDVDLWP